MFWTAFPKKRSKGAAEKVWKRLNHGPEMVAAMLAAIEALKLSPEWQKDGGQFIPYPATWLNAKGWEDEIPPPDAAHPCWWPGCRHRGLKARGRVRVCKTHLASLERGETP